MNPPICDNTTLFLADIEAVRQRESDLRLKNGQQVYISPNELNSLLAKMPQDFILTHPEKFSFLSAVGMRGNHPSLRFNAFIGCTALNYARNTDLAACAAILPSLVEPLPVHDRPEAADYLLRGQFVRDLSYAHPQAYAEFFMGIVGCLDDYNSGQLARVVPVDVQNGTYIVLPDTSLNLPPMALIRSGESIKISAVTPELAQSLPAATTAALKDKFEREATFAANHRHFGTSSHLRSAAMTLAP